MSKLTWKLPKDGFVVDCLLMAGDADMFQTVTFKFDLEEEKKMLEFVNIAEIFSPNQHAGKQKSFEQMVQLVAKKSKVHADIVEDYLSNLMISYEEEYEYTLVGYRIMKVEEQLTSYAMFGSNPYKKLHTISAEFFESWDLL